MAKRDMTTVADLVHEVQAVGGDLVPLDNGRIRITAPAPLPEHLMARLRERKPEVINFLAYREGRADGWDPETTQLIEWFMRASPPAQPFELCQGVTVARPDIWGASLRQDIAEGPDGPRAHYGAVQADLGRLAEVMGAAASRHGNEGLSEMDA